MLKKISRTLSCDTTKSTVKVGTHPTEIICGNFSLIIVRIYNPDIICGWRAVTSLLAETVVYAAGEEQTYTIFN